MFSRRDHLNEIRRHFNNLRLAEANAGIPAFQKVAHDEREYIAAATQSNAKFSSMVLDYVSQHPL